jgi:hypothetical protein
VKTGTLPVTVHPGFHCIWIEISLLVRFDIADILLRKEGIYKQAYLTRFRCVVMGDGVMAAIEYVRNVPGNTQACGVQRSPKYSIKAVVLIWVNCPAF